MKSSTESSIDEPQILTYVEELNNLKINGRKLNRNEAFVFLIEKFNEKKKESEINNLILQTMNTKQRETYERNFKERTMRFIKQIVDNYEAQKGGAYKKRTKKRKYLSKKRSLRKR
jgi:hypothetical protein